MTFFDLSIMATSIGTFILILVYLYIFINYRERYVGLWLASWCVYLFRITLLDPKLSITDNGSLLLVYQVVSFCSLILIVLGTSEFTGTRLSTMWAYGALGVTLFGMVAFLFQLSLLSATMLGAVYFAAIYTWTGFTLLEKLKIRTLSKYVTGSAFILLGIHAIDFPFLRTVAWFVPWGYFIDGVLRLVIAAGTLLVYFEKTRNDLIEKEEYYRLMTENAVDVIYRYRYFPEAGFEYISPAVSEVTGYDPSEYYADRLLEVRIVFQEDREILEAFRRNPNQNPIILRIVRKDGVQVWTEQRGVPIFSRSGTLIAFEGIIRDITERRRIEQDMSRLDGLNVIGQMAANIAHEIRNPMTTIRGYLQLLGNKTEFSNYREEFSLLLDELDRTNSLITEYLSLSKQKTSDFKNLSINKIIEALIPLLQADANASSKYIQLQLGDLPCSRFDEKEIRQLILNLARNGLEAMKSGGTLVISTYSEENAVILRIRDQGSGIPVGILEKLGTPFLTTKENGTGLGLAVCYSIANRHQASILVDSTNEGTTFYIRFPIPSASEKVS